MNVCQLHQLLKGFFEDHSWEWNISFLTDIYKMEEGLDLIDEWLSIIPHFLIVNQFDNKVSTVKHWTSDEYKSVVLVSLPVPALHPPGHPNHFKCIQSVTDFKLIASYYCLTETILKDPKDELGGISSTIHFFLSYHRSHITNQTPKIQTLLH